MLRAAVEQVSRVRSEWRRLTHTQEHKFGETVEIIIRDKSGVDHRVKAREGETVLDAANTNGVEIEAPCDGYLACGLCAVDVDERHHSKLPSPSRMEKDLMSFAKPGIPTTFEHTAFFINNLIWCSQLKNKFSVPDFPAKSPSQRRCPESPSPFQSKKGFTNKKIYI